MIPAMLRRLFTLFSALSLVLCVLLCVLWVRSYWVGDRLSHGQSQHPYTYWEVASFSGALRVSKFTFEHAPGLGAGWGWATAQEPGPYSPLPGFSPAWDSLKKGGWALWPGGDWQEVHVFRGVSFDTLPPDGVVRKGDPVGGRLYGVSLPHWYLAATLAVIPLCYAIIRLLHLRRKRRRKRGRNAVCPDCGHRLRATPGRCPECGAAPVEKKGQISN